jgi:thiamine-phosphate pyrophosphorylase
MELRGIYAVLDADVTYDLVALLADVVAAGVRIVQYRAKRGVDREVLTAMVALARRRGARVIVNDDLDAARLADGVHLGPEDLVGYRTRDLRAELGSRLLGVSCGTPDEVAAAEAAGADYLGVGPYAATATKLDAGPPIGPSGLAAVVAATRLPVAAIGGIECHDLAEVRAAGASMAAVVSAIARGPVPLDNALALVRRWRELEGE